MSRLATRATNLDKHPGQPDIKAKRCTQAEMKAVRIAEEKAKEEMQQVQVKKLKRIANLEDRMADDTAKIEAKHVTQSSQQPAKRSRASDPQALQHTYASLDVMEDDHDNAGDPLQEVQTMERAGHGAVGDASDAEASELTDIETENEHPKKKAKKQTTRKAIDAARKQNLKETKKIMKEPVIIESSEDEGTVKKEDAQLHAGNCKEAKAPVQSKDKKSVSGLSASGTIKNWAVNVITWNLSSKAADSHPPSISGTSQSRTATFKMARTEASTSTKVSGTVKKLAAKTDEINLIAIESGEGKSTLDQQYAEFELNNKLDDGTLVKSKKPKSTNATNADLPPGTLKLWWQVFVSTLECYVGTMRDPWSISDEKAVAVLQCVWDAVFTKAKIEHKVTREDFVCKLANQRLCEWCNSFGSTVLVVLEDLFGSDEDFEMTEQHANFAKVLLHKQRFVWNDADGPNESSFRGLFGSPLVLRTLAYYYKSTEGTINIPALYAIEMGESNKPYGAIRLAAASVCMIRFFMVHCMIPTELIFTWFHRFSGFC
ncbi:hypothetical protein SCP_1102870 [Sparassis crispa]|uniref:Uncharacterized protein n=1 Tax=Sparassis crispa TaxID=139825 RepID=A0A401GZM4_9APHY|nr:hypothetical protein SCP_1102870 [Sparassis crispa]GBE87610.1 hypothetical protein SCP_1102870 [Sparassis crispa]